MTMDARQNGEIVNPSAAGPPPARDTDGSSPSSQPTPRLQHHCGVRANAFMQRMAGACLPLAYLIGWFATWWFWLRDREARQSSCDYLRRLEPNRSKLSLLLRAHKHMYHYALSLIDCSAMLTGLGKKFTVTCPNRDALLGAIQSPGGLLILTAHVGSIEIAAPRMSQLLGGRRMHFVMYQDMSDETERFRAEKWRSLQTFNIINSMDAVAASIQTARALMAGEVVGMRADRRVSDRYIPADVLGAEARLPHGPFMAAVATGATVVFAFTFRTGYRRYELCVSMPRTYQVNDPDDKPQIAQRIAKEYASALSDALRRFPLQWFNFYPFWEAASGPQQGASTAETSNTG